MTTPPEPHKPAFQIRSSTAAGGDSNPWMVGLWLATTAAALAGAVNVGMNSDPEAFDYSPTAAALGYTLLGVTGVLLAGVLVAGAICWQLRRR